jgi:NDP-sugar pyrophosphorylase family protein
MTDLSRWPALVLTAGLATRLRPLSNVRAKAAMPVAGTTIIARILGWLQRSGVQRVVLNLHHQPDSVASIVGDGTQFGVQVRYSWEPVVLGSAGGPRRALPLLDADCFFVINGDTLTNCDLAALARRHDDTRARVTMAVVDGDVERYGGVLVDENDHVTGFGRPGPGTRAWHFIGVQAVNAGVFGGLPDGQPAETVRALYPKLLAENPRAIAVYHSAAEFLDVGTARDYLATVAIVAAREGRPFDVGTKCRIAPDARIVGSVLWDRVTVGAGAEIRNSIIADDVHVPAGARVENQVLVKSDSVYSETL